MTGTSEEAQKTFLQQRARDDVLSSDFQWSLFMSALTSYRHDTVLRPFPPAFTTGGSPTAVSAGGKDYQELKNVAEELISMRHLTVDNFYTQHSERLIQLLYWVLSPRTFTLSTCKKECYSDIQCLTGQVSPVPAPNYIFQVNYTEAAESKFKLAQGDRELMYGYHGSRLDNFHSILHHGLQGHMNKNSFFGEGTYLSSELAVSMPYAPTGGAWKHSSLGDKLGCVAVCEIINDPSVKCQTKGTEAGNDRTRSHAPNSMGGEVPEKYYVVRNNEMMRVKYLLVYSDTHIRNRRHGGLSWFRQHRFAVMICLYILLLVIISLYSSKSAQQTIRRWVYR